MNESWLTCFTPWLSGSINSDFNCFSICCNLRWVRGHGYCQCETFTFSLVPPWMSIRARVTARRPGGQVAMKRKMKRGWRKNELQMQVKCKLKGDTFTGEIEFKQQFKAFTCSLRLERLICLFTRKFTFTLTQWIKMSFYLFKIYFRGSTFYPFNGNKCSERKLQFSSNDALDRAERAYKLPKNGSISG